MNKKFYFLWLLIGLMGMLTYHSSLAAYKPLENVPWSTTNFEGYIQGVYNFAVAFVAVAALLMVTIGGFYYIVSAGNQAQAGTAKSIIKDALLGLVVVFVTWLILNTINPDLVKSTPSMTELQNLIK